MSDQTALFDQMDKAADLMRETNPYAGKTDMALLFRDIQLATMPDLSTEQYQDAFDPAVMAEHAPHVQAARRR
jgi:hypothetical protein